MIDKPRINREAALCEDRKRRQARQRFEQVCALLKADELLGAPLRIENRIVLSVSSSEKNQDHGQG